LWRFTDSADIASLLKYHAAGETAHSVCEPEDNMADMPKAEQSWLTTSISVGKDLVSLLRDSAIFVLALLLIAFPIQFNSILVSAGFEEGSLVGFKWKAKLVESDKALKDAQASISDLQTKNDELVKALADTNAKLKDPTLVERVEKLQDENSRLREATRQVQTTVSNAIESNIPLVAKALSSDRLTTAPRAKSDFSVGLQTLGVPDSDRVALNEKIHAAGYGLDPVTWSYPAGQRPSWFALRSTVFYYSSSSLPEAKELAETMKSLTGLDFSVQRGAGLGVDPARKDVTLYVHYVKN
jgi:hypothetical protein